MEEIKFNLLKDEPITPDKSGYFEFYHKYFSPALKEILTIKESVHTIGLFGGWGTGKSTIIDSLKKELECPIFIFDTWKYQEDALRRIFLLRLVDFISEKKGSGDIKINDAKFDKIKEEINSKLYECTQKKLNNPIKKEKGGFKQKIKENRVLLILFAVSILVLIGVYIWEKYYDLNEVVAKIVNYFASFSLLTSLITTIYLPFIKEFFKDILDRITKTIQPVVNLREVVEIEERLNSPEQFEMLFNEIVDSIENDQKFVIVFDNIDRVQGDVAIKILSTIKTFLDPLKNKNIIFLVPCDDVAVKNQIKNFYSEHNENDNEFDPSEFLRKLFNLIIYTPDFIDNDLEQYTKSLIDGTGDIKKYLNNENVGFIINSAFSNNPREIKQFINNFISLILVVSKTSVADEILSDDKIGYLAKLLVIKEKFPFAYKRLKKQWNKPESIVWDDDIEKNKTFVNFMTNTSHITVDDAEPFLYFKEPVLSSNLVNSKNIRQSLIDGNLTEFQGLVESENNKEYLVDYIILLLDKYKNYQDNILFNIFIVQLVVFSKLNVDINKKNYFKICLDTLNSKLWSYFSKIPVNTLFNYLLSNNNSLKQSVEIIIDKYIIVIENEDYKKTANQDLLINILQSILENVSILTSQQKTKVSTAIEKNYSDNPKVIDLYKTFEEQKNFISTNSFEKFISILRSDNIINLFPIIKRYKKFIEEAPVFDILFNKITEIVQLDNNEFPDFREEKVNFFSVINNLFNLFASQLDKIDDETRKQQLNVFIQSFNSITGYDNRYILINILKRYENRLSEPEKTNIHNLINDFFQNANYTYIEKVLNYWSESYIPKFISQYIATLEQRMINDDNILNVIFNKSNNDLKNEILSFIIKNRADHGIQFINSNDAIITNKVKVIENLLDKADSIAQPENRLHIYEYVNKNLKKNYSIDIKNIALSQIISLLKNDNSNSSLIGLQFLQGGDYLGDEKKREITKEVIAFLKEPSRTINENHANSINSIVFLFDIMNDSLKKDFIYLLFELLRSDNTELIISMALKAIRSTKPQINEYNKEYNDLLDRLRSWNNETTKKIIIDDFINNKLAKLSKEDKEFYDELEKI